MIQIDNKLLTDDIKDVHFVCDLQACKGTCCVQGDSGAPLEDAEISILEQIYSSVAPFITPEGRIAIQQQGTWVVDQDGDKGTPLIKGMECAYTIFENGIAGCGIEKAFQAGKIGFQKPISCHLYPIRVNHFERISVDSLNYDKWDICDAACELGAKLKVPLYKFLKAPLIRKFGESFYTKLVHLIEEDHQEKD